MNNLPSAILTKSVCIRDSADCKKYLIADEVIGLYPFSVRISVVDRLDILSLDGPHSSQCLPFEFTPFEFTPKATTLSSC